MARWVNAVLRLSIPLEVSPTAGRKEKLLAAVDKAEELETYLPESFEGCFEVTFEDVEDGEPTR